MSSVNGKNYRSEVLQNQQALDAANQALADQGLGINANTQSVAAVQQKVDVIEGKATGENLLLNPCMQINQRGGFITEFGQRVVAPHPYRFDSSNVDFVRPDGAYESLAFQRGVTLDEWAVMINDFGQSGGEGYVEQVRCLDAPLWVAATSYSVGNLVRSPGGFGAGYVYQCIEAHDSTIWDDDVKTVIDPVSFEALPRFWALVGLYETAPELQGKYALHWVQTAGSTGETAIEQRVLGICEGVHTFAAKVKARSGAPSLSLSVVSEFGVGQADGVKSAALGALDGTVQALISSREIAAGQESYSGFHANNRFETTQVSLRVAAGQTFDLLITDCQFLKGLAVYDELSVSFDEEYRKCLSRYWKTNPWYLPARWASYRPDSVLGEPQFTCMSVGPLWDRYGLIKEAEVSGSVVNWGGTNRAYLGNEDENAGRGKVRAVAEREAKAFPPFNQITFPAPMIREPDVRVFDVIGAQEGFASAVNRFNDALRFDYTGAGSAARPYSQRALVKVANFYVTTTRADFNAQNIEPLDKYEELSGSVVLPTGQDALSTACLTLKPGYKYDWDWAASGSGTDVYYLHLSNAQFHRMGVGALENIPDWAAGNYVAGDVVRVAGSYRYYECIENHSSLVAPDDNSVEWMPYGRITFPLSIKLDGVKSGRNLITNPAALGGLQWWFGDNDSLGFKTLYVRMNSAPVDPGSSLGRVKAEFFDNYVDQFEQLMFNAEFDASPYTWR